MKTIEERINDTNVTLLIEWVGNPRRKPAILSFTEGPARQLAYAIEISFAKALKRERETTAAMPPLTMRPTEPCSRCGFTQAARFREVLPLG